MNERTTIWSRFGLPAIIAVIGVFLLAPIGALIATSFSESVFLSFPPKGFTFRWYAEVLQNPGWGQAALNSLMLAIATVIIVSLIAVPASIVLARGRIPGSELFISLMMAPLMVPTIMFVLGVMLIYGFVGMATPAWGIVLALTVIVTPYMMRTLLAALISLDPALEEASMNLGASRVRTWLLVVLPNVSKSYISGLVLCFVLAFDEFLVPLFLAGPRFSTLPVEIYRGVAFDVSPEVSAVSTLLIIATALISLVAARDIRSVKV